MRFRYSVLDALQPDWESQPRVPLFLFTNQGSCEVLGLVDSGAMVNTLPYQFGLRLGATWDDDEATVQMGGIVRGQSGIPLILMAKVGNLPPVKLAFSWVKSDEVPVILGQLNFFMKFDVCFYRSQGEFEVKPITANA